MWSSEMAVRTKLVKCTEGISVWPPLPWTWCCSFWWMPLLYSLEKPVLQLQQLPSMAYYLLSLRIKRLWTTARRYYFRLPRSEEWPAKYNMKAPMWKGGTRTCKVQCPSPARGMGTLCYEILCPTSWNHPYTPLHSLSKHAGQIDRAVIKPQRCALGFNSAWRLTHRGRNIADLQTQPQSDTWLGKEESPLPSPTAQ